MYDTVISVTETTSKFNFVMNLNYIIHNTSMPVLIWLYALILLKKHLHCLLGNYLTSSGIFLHFCTVYCIIKSINIVFKGKSAK